MSKTVTTLIQVSVSGDNFAGGPVFSHAMVNVAGLAPGSFILAAGFNSIPIPSTALGVTIVPPPTSTNGKTLKGLTGDTGIPIDPANETSLTFTAAQNATLGITSVGAETLTLLWK